MKIFARTFACALALLLPSGFVRADQTNIAEDDAGQDAYNGGFDTGKNGGSGFGDWKVSSNGNGTDSFAGFYVANQQDHADLKGIANNGKAWGLYANGTSFEQAVAFRPFKQPLAVGDSFSFLMETGPFEKKTDKSDDQGGGSVGLSLKTSNSSDSPADYNKDATFEFGIYQGKPNYQVYDGSDQTDTGVPFTDMGVTVTVTLTAADTYDLEIKTMSDKKLTKLSGRKFKSGDPIQSLCIFDRNSEKYDSFFNSLQVTRENK